MWDDRPPGAIGATVFDIDASGGRALAVRVDLTDRDDTTRWVDTARNVWGGPTRTAAAAFCPATGAQRPYRVVPGGNVG